MRQPVAQAVGWALLQFVWQGAVVGVLTARRCWRLLRRSAADIRYVVATIGLALMLTLPIVTAVQSLAAFAAASRRRNRGDQTAPRHLRCLRRSRTRGRRRRRRSGRITSRQRRCAGCGVAPGAPGTVESFEPWLPLLSSRGCAAFCVLSLRLLERLAVGAAADAARASPAADTLAARGSNAGAAAAHRAPRPAARIGAPSTCRR